MKAVMRTGRPAHLRTPSLPSLTESESDSIADGFEEIVEEALDCIACVLRDCFDDENDGQAAILTVEAALCVDDVLSWLECMTEPAVSVTSSRQEQLSALVRNIVRIRQLVLRDAVTDPQVLATTSVALQSLSPSDVFKYVVRFNRLVRSNMNFSTLPGSRLAMLENALRLYIHQDDATMDLQALPAMHALCVTPLQPTAMTHNVSSN